MLSILEVNTKASINTVVQLADKIWRAHYVAIIGQQQVDYMLENFQSASAIQQQIKQNTHYFLLQKKQFSIGYFALEISTDNIHLSKIYIDPEEQRQGLGQYSMAFIENYCLQANIQQLWLVVNRHNTSAIQFYIHCGFINTGHVIKDIGNGFVMDDFKMIKKL